MADTGIHRTRAHDHTQKAAHRQNEHAHIHSVIEAVEGGQDHIPHALGVLLHRVVGAGHGHAVYIVILSRRHEPGGDGHQNDEAKQNGIGRGHFEFGHGARLLSF